MSDLPADLARSLMRYYTGSHPTNTGSHPTECELREYEKRNINCNDFFDTKIIDLKFGHEPLSVICLHAPFDTKEIFFEFYGVLDLFEKENLTIVAGDFNFRVHTGGEYKKDVTVCE